MDAWFCGYVAAARGLRLGRLPEGGDPALRRRGLARRLRRLAAGVDLEPLHVAGGGEAADPLLPSAGARRAHGQRPSTSYSYVPTYTAPRPCADHDGDAAPRRRRPSAEPSPRRSRKPAPPPAPPPTPRPPPPRAAGDDRAGAAAAAADALARSDLPEAVGDDGHALALRRDRRSTSKSGPPIITSRWIVERLSPRRAARSRVPPKPAPNAMCAAAFSSISVWKYVRPLWPMRDVASTSATSPSRRPLPLGSLSMYAATKSRSFFVAASSRTSLPVAELAAQIPSISRALERERERARERAVRARRRAGS